MGEIRVCSGTELVTGVSTVVSGIVSEVLREIEGMELSILSIGGRSDDVAAEALPIKSSEGAGSVSKTMPGTNFFLQS